ncbi:unnamed protein product, partial [marine sediment metagenome]
MVTGRPDWTTLTAIKGVDKDGNFVILLSDADGRIITVIRDPETDNYAAIDENGYLTTVMKGLKDLVHKTVAVDDAGNLVTVVKGEYADALKTIQLDSEGRMRVILIDPETSLTGGFVRDYKTGIRSLAVSRGAGKTSFSEEYGADQEDISLELLGPGWLEKAAKLEGRIQA